MSDTSYLLEKAAAGERLYFDECVTLYQEASLLELGMAAKAVRRLRVPGAIVTYLVDRNINYTNVCTTRCRFCGFHRPPGHPEAFVCNKGELSQKIEELLEWGGTRILLQGGHNPELGLDWYLDVLSWLKERYPTIERDCFSPSEVAHIASLSKMTIYETLERLRDAGLQGLPGSGAEILDDEIRDRYSPGKLKTDEWLKIMRAAQKLNLNTSATMVIGLDETIEHRIRHLQRIRDLQDYSLREHGNGFFAFISWTMQFEEGSMLARNGHRHGATAHEYLRHAAIARIFLDNVLHHQASWVTQGPKVAQVSLEFGMDDFGSTMLEENVVSSSTSNETIPCMPEREIHALIRDAGYTPAKRDTAYNLLNVFDGKDGAAQPLTPDPKPVVQPTNTADVPPVVPS
jgi:cyclic dehypoxanthinyl futalosine synthase